MRQYSLSLHLEHSQTQKQPPTKLLARSTAQGISIQRPHLYPTPRIMEPSHQLRNVSPAPNDHRYLRQHLTYKVTTTPTMVATPATMPTIASTLSALLGPGASLTLSEMLTLDVPPPVTLTLMLLFLLLLLSPDEPVVGEHQHTCTAGWEAVFSYLKPHRPSPSPRTQSWSASGTSCT